MSAARIATLLALYNVCQAAKFSEEKELLEDDRLDSSEDESWFSATSRMLKGGRGGGGRGFRGSSGRSGGSSCEGDDCPPWWVGLIVFGAIVLLGVCFIYTVKCYNKCKNRRNPLYIPPP